MPLTNEHEAIRVCYEDEKFSVEQIASDRGMEVAVVKAALMAASSQYRKQFKKDDEDEIEDFSSQDLRDANNTIRYLNNHAETEELRFKAATYIRDDKKGRKEVVKTLQQPFNLLVFNEAMQTARQAREERRSINVQSQVTQAA